MHSDLPLVEPIAVQDIFMSGIAEIEDMGEGMFRAICYAVRKNPHDHTHERVIVASLVMSKETIVRNMFLTAKMLDVSIGGEISHMPRGGEALN